MQKIFQHNYVKIQKSKTGSKDVLVCFSAVKVPEGKFSFLKSFINRTENVIYINCPDRTWYINGVPDLGEDIDEVSRSINELCKELGGEDNRAIFIGTAMGGAGAVCYGAKHPNAIIIAGCVSLNFNTLTGSFTGGFRGCTIKTLDDLYDLIQKSKNQFYIFCGELDLSDIMDAYYIKNYPNVTIITIENETHGVFDMIECTSGINNFINNFLENNATIDISPLKQGRLLTTNNKLPIILYKAFYFLKVCKNTDYLLKELNLLQSEFKDDNILLSYIEYALYLLYDKLSNTNQKTSKEYANNSFEHLKRSIELNDQNILTARIAVMNAVWLNKSTLQKVIDGTSKWLSYVDPSFTTEKNEMIRFATETKVIMRTEVINNLSKELLDKNKINETIFV